MSVLAPVFLKPLRRAVCPRRRAPALLAPDSNLRLSRRLLSNMTMNFDKRKTQQPIRVSPSDDIPEGLAAWLRAQGYHPTHRLSDRYVIDWGTDRDEAAARHYHTVGTVSDVPGTPAEENDESLASVTQSGPHNPAAVPDIESVQAWRDAPDSNYYTGIHMEDVVEEEPVIEFEEVLAGIRKRLFTGYQESEWGMAPAPAPVAGPAIDIEVTAATTPTPTPVSTQTA